jgi:predicted component of type VI protein secretion system
MQETDKVRELFARFVKLRQNAQSRDEAWYAIEDAAILLAADEREQLITMLRIWEANEGQAYKSADDPFETQNKPPAKLAEKRNVIRRIRPARQASPASDVECPTCHKPNPSGSMYCDNCGAVLPLDTPPNATRPLGTSSADDAFFGEDWVLYFKVQGTAETLRIQPRQTEMILGRKSPDSVMVPDVDLSAYNAGNQGVSRLHASIRQQEDTLVLTDLGSVNHTFINGQRVHAHEVRVLHDGDEVRLGRLVLYSYFRES